MSCARYPEALCYVAGPMSGLPGLNFDAFHLAAKSLRAQGWTVVNPAEINPDLNADWTGCMIEDIKELSKCDAIYLLAGWTNSYGAQIEHLVAKKLGLTIYFEEDPCVSL
jgi:hypothetical protein